MLVQVLFCAMLFFLSMFLLQATLIASKKRLPGPFALPFIGHLHLLGANLHQSFHHLSCRYGPLIRICLGSLQCVVVSSPELARDFLRTHELTFSSRPSTSAMELLSYNVSFALAPYGPYWKFAKKLCTYQLFGSRNLNHFRPLRTMEIHRLLQLLQSKARAGETVNVSEEIMKTMNNVISQMMLSIRCMENRNDSDEARSIVREVTKIFGEFDLSNIVWFCRNLDLQGLRKRSMDTHGKYDALMEKIIRKREGERSLRKGDSKDLLDMLLDVMEDDKSEVKFTRDHLKALVLDFFTAGTDTSSSAIEWALSELINNPRVLKKAQEEVDRIVGSHRLVEESDGPNLPYIQAILKETFRLHPPVPMITRKSTEVCVINGYKIASDTMVFVNVWSIGRNPKYWESPLEFRPERFLQPTKDDPLGQIDVKGQHFELLPFGTGRRGCPGMNLSMQELPAVLAAMIQCFDWKIAGLDGQKINGVDMSERPGLTTPRAHDLICRLEPRIDLHDILCVS